MINVLFFAQLKEQLKTDQLQVDIKTPCTVADLQNKITSDNPAWQGFLDNRTLLAAVNQDMVQADHNVNEGDEVAFFPPVTGG